MNDLIDRIRAHSEQALPEGYSRWLVVEYNVYGTGFLREGRFHPKP